MTQIITESAAPSFDFIDTNGQAIPIKTISLALLASTANQQVIAAVTGKRLRVLSVIAQNGSAATSVNFKDGSGGAVLISITVPAAVNNILDINRIGWGDTSAGVGLYADTGGQVVAISIRYIEFTQSA